MSDNILTFPTASVLERGDHVELALRLLDEDTVSWEDRRVRPVTEAGEYHVFDSETGLWVHVPDEQLEVRVDSFAGAPVEGAKGPYPLRMRETDARAVVSVMKRHTCRTGFFRTDLVAFRNGYVLAAGADGVEYERTRPWHGQKDVLDVDYNPHWTMPDGTLLERYIETTFDYEQDRARLVEILGAALFGMGPRFKKAWFLADGLELRGRGGSGKSQFLAMLKGLVPPDRHTSVPPQDWGDDHYKGIQLRGKTLNVVFEAPSTDILREEAIKAVVFGEPIQRRAIRQDPVTFRCHALHVFACNHLPSAPGASAAFYDRWAILEFSKRFRGGAGEVTEVGQRVLDDELAVLVHLAVSGAQRLIEQGGYTSPHPDADRIEHWKRESDPVARFFAECTEPLDVDVLPADWTASRTLYEACLKWLNEQGHRSLTLQTFGRRVPATVKKARSNGSKYAVRLLSYSELAMQDEEGWGF